MALSEEKNKQNEGVQKPTPPSISLPKGGGAIRGIGEKFAANPVTGTGSMTVPIATSPGRSGFGPQLSLSYDSGSGNGPFGFGWNLSLPSITRKTDKRLPKYQDADESDVFILSGAEDLVPLLNEAEDGSWSRHEDHRTVDEAEYVIHRYRPRIEGLFARIERWTNLQSGEIHWRSISRDNITTLYGKTAESRLADPTDSNRVFSWLICESYDDKGNAVVYEYVPEDSASITLSQANERNRTEDSRSANRYLKRVKYGNQTSRLIQPDLARMGWLFEVVFDYDEGHYEPFRIDDNGREFVQAQMEKTRDWPVRQDPFSSYKAGFENRTYRLCHRALMFHHFPDELGVDDYLVRSTEFTYDQSPIASFITHVTQSGFKRQDDGTYLKKSLPPLEFEYSKATIQDKVQDVDEESLENLPQGLDGAQYQWVDIDGEGLSGILTEQGDAWFYKRNVSALPVVGPDGQLQVVARFTPIEHLAAIPSFTNLSTGRQQLLDLAGDGQLDVVEFGSPTPGFYERTKDEAWHSFKPFVALPHIPWQDPNLKFVDLTGDGHADIFITEDEAFTWYLSLAETGFASGEKVRQALDEEKGPKLVFADGTQSIYLADISGDGLSDLVRIRNGEVCYWPNLGYGRFGAKVTMDNPPHFDTPDHFDQRRIRLADIDGSGVTDIIYLKGDGVYIYLNESGNRWADAEKLKSFPQIDNLSSVIAVDLLGNGTACLVWSSPLPADERRPMRYIDLMGGQKPHLLVKSENNLGAETHVHYAPSTKFYLADKAAGTPWITRLPFPVHVVERIDTYDRISRNRFVTRYAYHHGYFDGIEREFRGFGRVDQWDTEEFAALSATGEFRDATNIDEASHVPPVLTRTWFHTGAYIEGGRISRQFAEEYYRESDPSAGLAGLTDEQLQILLLEDTVLPDTLPAEEAREACRALKGSILRQEIYALDNTEEADRPYRVSERNYTIRRLQACGENRHAVFFAHTRETIDFHYERKLVEVDMRHLADPRVTHSMTLSVDDYGNVLRSVAIAYRRRALPGVVEPGQTVGHITFTVNRVANRPGEEEWYRAGLPVETRTYEIVNPPEPDIIDRLVVPFRFETIQGLTEGLFPSASEEPEAGSLWPYERWDWRRIPAHAPSETRLRPIEHLRTIYRRNDLTGPRPLGEVESLALPYESYKLAFTPGLIAEVYGDRITEDMLANEGRYVHSEGDSDWWIPSGHIFYSPDSRDTPAEEEAFANGHFFLPHRFRDPFGNTSQIEYDEHNLLVQETCDALSNRVTAGERNEHGTLTIQGNDYRVLQPRIMMDPNRNRTAVAFDTLGMVVRTAVMGKPEEHLGDSLDGFEPDLEDAVALDHLEHPFADPHSILQYATTRLVYDLFAFLRTREHPQPQPAVVYTLARETHDADLESGGLTRVQHSFSYSDGFGREIQKKIQAEPGPIEEGGPDVSPRWVGSGWTIFNNKGKPVRKYEPFFSPTHGFEFARIVGVSSVLFYDPIGRVVATLHPNHTYEKVVFDPWRQETWDVNDTLLQPDPETDPDVGDRFRRLPDADYLPTWYGQRHGGGLGTQEQAAANKAAVHAGTPTIAHFDTLGRAFLTVAHNRFERESVIIEEHYTTRVHLDIESNQREVIDARDRMVMRYDYDMLGNRIHQASMEAGERWTLNDVGGNPIRAWDSRGHDFRTEYDELRRPVHAYVQGAMQEDLDREILYEQTEYGEGQPGDIALNLRTRIFRQYDAAGIITNAGANSQTGLDEAYDFKGNLLHSIRQPAADYKSPPDWYDAPVLAPEAFTSDTLYDALNRPVSMRMPDDSIIRPAYNEANLLERITANLRGADTETTFVDNIDYNARGQRTLIAYGNHTRTEYVYDPETFRLTHLFTTRGAATFPDDCPRPPHPPCGVQNLHYTYDPTGNITHIRDDAQQTIFFRNRRVDPDAEYTYDAIYRLIEATGREHLGQHENVPLPPVPTSHSDAPRVDLLHPGDGNAMGRYLQRYIYDEVGNFLEMIHHGTDPEHPGWRRTYSYDEPSQLEPGTVNNRLSSTTIGTTTARYRYDGSAGLHGNITAMPHLPLMAWNFKDQLQASSGQVRTDGGTPEITYYVYDASGQRVRKVTERQAAPGQMPTRMNECIYIGGFEVYREYGGDGERRTLERETLHIMDNRQRIAMVETKTIDVETGLASPQPVIRFQLNNHLGSSSLELNEDAQVISYEEYYPYGSTSYQAVRNDVEVSQKRYRYTGMERDEETGLNYHGTRYYAPWLGRWTQCDPAGLIDGTNPYQYALNRPLVFLDTAGSEVARPPSITYPEMEEPPIRYPVRGGGSIEVRRPSARGAAYEHVGRIAGTYAHQIADEYNQIAGEAFISTIMELAQHESGGTFAQRALSMLAAGGTRRIIYHPIPRRRPDDVDYLPPSERVIPREGNSSIGVFQIMNVAAQEMTGNPASYPHEWTPFEEINVPVGYYADTFSDILELGRQGLGTGGTSIEVWAARSVFLQHVNPHAHRRFLSAARRLSRLSVEDRGGRGFQDAWNEAFRAYPSVESHRTEIEGRSQIAETGAASTRLDSLASAALRAALSTFTHERAESQRRRLRDAVILRRSQTSPQLRMPAVSPTPLDLSPSSAARQYLIREAYGDAY